MTRKGAIKALAMLTAAYTREIPDATIELYVASLADLPDDLLAEIVGETILTSRWLPTIAELREAVVKRVDPRALPPSPDSAWASILVASENCDAGMPTDTHEAVISALKAVGGLWRIGMSRSPDSFRKPFLGAYSALSDEARRRALALGVCARLELDEAKPTQSLDATRSSLPKAQET